MNINKLVGKPYDKEKYHCWTFVEEVLDVPTLADVHVDSAKGDIEKYKGLFEEIFVPENNCIVQLGDSHVGINYNGGAYHNDIGGVRYETHRALKMKYKEMKFYRLISKLPPKSS